MKNTEPLISSIKPTANTTVFAKWSDDPVFSVSFDGQGSPDELPGITGLYSGDKITRPAPSRTGYASFKGKYFDIGGDAGYMLCIPPDRSKIDLRTLTFH